MMGFLRDNISVLKKSRPDSRYLYAMLVEVLRVGIIVSIVYFFMPVFTSDLLQAQGLVSNISQIEDVSAFKEKSDAVLLKIIYDIAAFILLLIAFAIAFRGFTWHLHCKGFKPLSFFRQYLLRYVLLSTLFLTTFIFIISPLAAIFYSILGSGDLFIASLAGLSLLMICLPAYLLLRHISNCLFPMLFYKKTLKASFLPGLKAVLRIDRYILPYLILWIFIPLSLLLLYFILGEIGLLKLLPIKGLFVVVALVFSAYRSWSIGYMTENIRDIVKRFKY